jgi:hypothetical protein
LTFGGKPRKAEAMRDSVVICSSRRASEVHGDQVSQCSSANLLQKVGDLRSASARKKVGFESVSRFGVELGTVSFEFRSASPRCSNPASAKVTNRFQLLPRRDSPFISELSSPLRFAEQGARANDHGRHAACYRTVNLNETAESKS